MDRQSYFRQMYNVVPDKLSTNGTRRAPENCRTIRYYLKAVRSANFKVKQPMEFCDDIL